MLAVLLLLLSGCVSRPMLYSHVTEPATKKFQQTPVGSKQCLVHGYRVREPFTGHGISAEWDTHYLNQVALQAGITNVYYADIETLSIFFQIYQRRTLIIYGD